MPNRITIADVAREAKVSAMTVSRVINNKEGVGKETRQYILDVIERLGYRPNSIARGLVTNRTGTLGLVVPDNANPFFSEIARGIEHAAYAKGYNVFLCNTEEDTKREALLLQSLSEKRVDGVIVCSSRLPDEELSAAIDFHSAVVLINRNLEKEGVVTLRVDDEKGAILAVQHLINSGHQAIGFLAGPTYSFSSKQRATGYRKAMEMAGLPINPDWIKHGPPMVEAGQIAAMALLSAYPEITALFCYNDLVAVGALNVCVDGGCDIPTDIAIVGFDDIFLSALVTPTLTTCHVPRYEIGQQAAQLLLSQIENRPTEKNVIIQPKLVIRASAP